jgi:uncharacterized protein YraI
MIGIAITFVTLVVVLPLSGDEDKPPVVGQAAAQAQPPAAAAAGLGQAQAPAPAASPTPATPPGLSATSRAFPNVRRGPALDAQIVRNLTQGQKVNVIGRSSDSLWLQITNPDNPSDKLWVSADMLDVTGDPRTLPEVKP